MALYLIMEEIRRRWPNAFPRLIYMPALDIAFPREDGRLYLDMGEIDDVIGFYNQVADDVNTLCRKTILSRARMRRKGKVVDSMNVCCRMGFTLPVKFGFDNYQVHVICYCLDRDYSAAGYFVRGEQETTALLDMDRRDIVVEKIAEEDFDNPWVLTYLGGIYAARQHNIPDAEIKKYMRKERHKDPAAHIARRFGGVK